jgi:hypothetical protein
MRYFAVFLLVSSTVQAGPNIQAGDLVLRHDIQRLADYGIIQGPVTTWPLAWGPILDDIAEQDASMLPPAILSSLLRVRDRANWETRTQELTFNTKVAAADNATRIRSFQNTPRGKVEVAAGASWIGDWFSIDLNVQAVDSDQDDEELRADDAMIGVIVGNWSIAASTQQRWWGPGWDGSLILSNNARPIPSLVIDRVFTDPFKTKWLSWVGPWDLSVIFGQMESDRHVSNTQFFGMRLNFKPLSSLEIGLSRSAQWCGDGRPCDAGTFADLFLGNDNRGGAGINSDNEPGNQLAGVDIRWAPRLLGGSTALYGQFMGEDEAGGFPSRWLGQFGGEWSGFLFERWSTRIYAEFAGTSCQFYETSELLNCAYNHGIYQTGYRYRSRSLGHAADNDARLVSVGAVAVDSADTQWRALLRVGALNRGAISDSRNSLTPTRQDIVSVDLSHSRVFSFGVIDLGVGYEMVDDISSGLSSSDGRLYVEWRSSY